MSFNRGIVVGLSALTMIVGGLSLSGCREEAKTETAAEKVEDAAETTEEKAEGAAETTEEKVEDAAN